MATTDSATNINSGHLIDGNWNIGNGEPFDSLCPVDNHIVWSGRNASETEVNGAFSAARNALSNWSLKSNAERMQLIRSFAENVKSRADELALLISRETGKPVWESRTEVGAVIGKAEVSIEAFSARRDRLELDLNGQRAVTRFKPHGVVAVLGPFNFPAHLANGHIIPALLAGNTVVFKPSEQSPAVGAWMAERWVDAGLPAGVVNLVQGGRDTGIAVSSNSELDGLFFTGSSAVGKALHKSFANYPQKILALEMGGNNPLIVHNVKDPKAAAYHTVLSAFITAGQRCTCARRLILVDNQASEDVITELVAAMGRVRAGFFTDDPEPFLGTVISADASRQLQQAYENLVESGAKPLVPMKTLRDCDALLAPTLLDSSAATPNDDEWFGPMLQIFRAKDFDDAIRIANDTAYGLSAGLMSDERDCFDHFIARIRAGVVNWNRQTTGASGKLPFGGCGLSGNHRPSGYYAADYCSFPVASLEADELTLPDSPMIGIDF